MDHRWLRLAAVTAALLFTWSAVAAPQSRDQQKCINELNKDFAKVARTQRKEAGKCMRDGAHGKLGARRIEACMTADNQGKLAKARQKTLDGETRKCTQSPDFGYAGGGVTNQEATDSEIDLVHDLFGSDLDTAAADFKTDKTGALCQQHVLKRAGKCADAFIKEYNRCKKQALAGSKSTAPAASPWDLIRCKGADPKGKIAKACETRITDTIGKKCSGLDTDTLFPGCAGLDLQRCIAGHAKARPSQGINGSDALCADPPDPNVPAPPLPEPISLTQVPLPSHIFALNETPRFTPDGDHILFPFRSHQVPDPNGTPQLGLIATDGSGFACLTCGLPAPVGVMRVTAFPDNQRALIQSNTTDQGDVRGRVLECAPSLLDCQSARVLDIVPPAAPPGVIAIQDREYRLSPDGVHVAWNQVRFDSGLTGVFGTLQRNGDPNNPLDPLRYDTVNAYVLYGSGFLSGDPNNLQFDDRSAFGGLTEARGFSDGGRSLLYLGNTQSANYDLFKLDLATGKRTRITRNIEYEDPIAASPDGKWYVVMSTRTVSPPRLAVFSQLPRPPLMDFGMGLQFAYHRNDVFTRRRFFQAWLLDAQGDRGSYIGQRIDPNIEPTFNGRADAHWHPDGTKILMWEQEDPVVAGGGEDEWWAGRIRIAHLDSRTPAAPPTPFTPEPTWALPYANSAVPISQNVSGIVRGAVSGYARVQYTDAGFVNGAIDIKYVNYSDDSRAIVNGTETGQYALSQDNPWQANLRLSGCRQGFLEADMLLNSGAAGTGPIQSEVDGNLIEGVTIP